MGVSLFCFLLFPVHILSALNQNLESKARTYKDLALAAIFRLNNYHYVAKQIRTTYSYTTGMDAQPPAGNPYLDPHLAAKSVGEITASLLKEVGEAVVLTYDKLVAKARESYGRARYAVCGLLGQRRLVDSFVLMDSWIHRLIALTYWCQMSSHACCCVEW